MPACQHEAAQNHDDACNEDGAHVLGYRQIPGLVLLAVDNFNDFTFVVAFGCNLEGGVTILPDSTVLHTGG